MCERFRLINIDGVKSEGCEGRVSLDKTDGDPGRGDEPADIHNKMDTLVVLSIESENLGDGDIPYVHLGGTSWHAGDVNRLGN